MGGSRSHSIFCVENHPKIALNQYRYFGVVYHMYSVCIYTLLKVVSYYEDCVKRDVRKAGEEEDWKKKKRDRGGGKDYQLRAAPRSDKGKKRKRECPSTSVMGYQKKSLYGASSVQFYFGFLNFFLTLQSP